MSTSSLTTAPVILRVTEWDESKAWTRDTAHTRNMLVNILRSSTPMSNLEAKRLIKAVLSKQSGEIELVDGTSYANMCHALQSIGAVVEAIPRAKEPS